MTKRNSLNSKKTTKEWILEYEEQEQWRKQKYG